MERYTFRKQAAFLLSLILLLQGCRSYEGVGMPTVLDTDKKVRVTTLDGKKYTGIRLEGNQGTVRGMKTIGGILGKEEKIVFELPVEEIRSVEIIDKADTIVRNVLFFTVAGGAFIWLGLEATNSMF